KPEKVHVHGRLDSEHIPSFHRRYNVLIAPSMEEGMPNAAMEACATGNLVIGSSVGGLPELIKHGETGILVPAGDERALMHAMYTVIRDPGLIGKLGAAARIHVESAFDSASFAEKYFHVYQTLTK